MELKTVSDLYAVNAAAGIRPFVKGMDYFRFRENLMIAGELRDLPPEENTLLEVGCGEETFGIFLAQKKGFSVQAVDIDEDKAILQNKYWKRTRNGRGSFQVHVADAQQMPFPDNMFGAATCCAVLPLLEGDGDCRVMREIGRVLKPGGRAFVTAGFGAEYAEFRETVSTKAFSRVYDEQALRERLVDCSGLRLEKRLYFGQPLFSFSEWWYSLPFPAKLPFRWMIPLCTLAFLRSIDPARRPDYPLDSIDGVLLVLRKGA